MPWDPNTEQHMDHVLLCVKAYWKKNPHQRLGQLLVNAARFDPDWKGGSDIFAIEDNHLIRNMIK